MKRERTRGFKLRRKLVKVFRWVLRSRRHKGYQRLDQPPTRKENSITRIRSWGSYLKQGAKKLCGSKPYCKAGRLGWDPVCEEKRVEVPKGHLAVYVGRRDDDPHRILVPVIYFNHPLFGELLREAEREFGYNHPGRITIPCPVSEFEKVKMRIAEGRKMTRHRD